MTEEGDLLWNAVTEALSPILHRETQLEPNKLEKRVRDYFKKGSKNLAFRAKRWDELIEEYADNVFGSLFCGLGDRDWLLEADFLLVMDAGVKEQFPAALFEKVPQHEFESLVLAASDRASDDQRYLHFRWEVVQREVQGKVSQKKIGTAMDAARVQVVRQAPQDAETFIEMWVSQFFELLCRVTQNEPQHILPHELCQALFEVILQEGGLPLTLTAEFGILPTVWEALTTAIDEVYKDLIGAEQAAAFERSFMKGSGATDLDALLQIEPRAKRRKTGRS